jgi:NADH dehydrogenase FAD-containing subunit
VAYWLAQFVGAVAAAAILRGSLGNIAHVGSTLPSGSQGQSFHWELAQDLRYDKLVVATGARPVRPPVPGIDRERVYQLHTIGNSLVLQEALVRAPERAVIVDAGYIGLEMTEALRARCRRDSRPTPTSRSARPRTSRAASPARTRSARGAALERA